MGRGRFSGDGYDRGGSSCNNVREETHDATSTVLVVAKVKATVEKDWRTEDVRAVTCDCFERSTREME